MLYDKCVAAVEAANQAGAIEAILLSQMELEEDDELNLGQVGDAEVEAEENAEPEMMTMAGYWDNFLALEAESKEPWATPADDTDEYREGRAVKFFNLSSKVANDLFALNPEIAGCGCFMSYALSCHAKSSRWAIRSAVHVRLASHWAHRVSIS